MHYTGLTYIPFNPSYTSPTYYSDDTHTHRYPFTRQITHIWIIRKWSMFDKIQILYLYFIKFRPHLNVLVCLVKEPPPPPSFTSYSPTAFSFIVTVSGQWSSVSGHPTLLYIKLLIQQSITLIKTLFTHIYDLSI